MWSPPGPNGPRRDKLVMDPIHLVEHETRSIELSQAEADELAMAAGDRLRVGLSGTEGRYTVTSTSHVGVIVGQSVTVMIHPKVPLRNLFLLLGVSPPAFEDSWFRFGRDSDLLTIMAAVFSHAVNRATARGVVRGYRHSEERLLSPRGRIDIVEQVRRPGLASPIACRFDEYTADVLPNRALVAAMDRIRRVPGLSPGLRTRLHRMDGRFQEVAHVDVEARQLERWVPGRTDAHYRQAMHLARLILANLSLGLSAGDAAAATFTLDMNLLFQDFVTDRLHSGLRGRLEVVAEPSVALATRNRLKMKPDLVFRRGDRDVYVGDVKYKLSSGPARMSDYYQLLAYTTAMSLDEGVLIYAQDPGDADDDTSGERVHTVEIRNVATELHVYRLPLSGSNAEVEAGLDELGTWLLQRRGNRFAIPAA